MTGCPTCFLSKNESSARSNLSDCSSFLRLFEEEELEELLDDDRFRFLCFFLCFFLFFFSENDSSSESTSLMDFFDSSCFSITVEVT